MSTQQFVRNHYAKLSWKLVKHGLGVLTMTEEREGHDSRIHNQDIEKPEIKYLEIPIRP